MGKNEGELIKYPKIKHLKMFVDSIYSREDHLHNDFELFIVLKNNGIAKIYGKTIEIKEGDVVLVNSGEVHSYQAFIAKNKPFIPSSTSFKPPLLLCIQFSTLFIRDYFPQIRTTVFNSGKLSDYIPNEILNEIRNILFDAAINYFSEKEYFALKVVSDLTLVLCYLYQYVNHEIISESQKQKLKMKIARLERIISYIDKNYDNQIRLQELADMENLSITHFSHLFSSTFGVTFQEFINLKRTEHCLKLMKKREKTLLEISYEAGFSDPKYMNKMINKLYGCSPKEYRKSLLEVKDQYLFDFDFGDNRFNDIQSMQAVIEAKELVNTSY